MRLKLPAPVVCVELRLGTWKRGAAA